jgi:hypothetical protein
VCGKCGEEEHREAMRSPGLVFVSKGMMPLNGQGEIEQIVSVTVDGDGRITKALVSRGGRLLATVGSRSRRNR